MDATKSRKDELRRNENGQIIIASRKGDDLLRDISGRIIISARKRITEDGEQEKKLAKNVNFLDMCDKFEFKADKKKKNKKKHKKNKKSKLKKQNKKKNKENVIKFKRKDRNRIAFLDTLKDNELDERKVVMSSLLSEISTLKEDILVTSDDDIYFYNSDNGCFEKKNDSSVRTYIMSQVSKSQRVKINQHEIENAKKFLCNIPEIKGTFDDVDTMMLVNCVNGIYDIKSDKLCPHKRDYKFKRYIRANFNEKATGRVFDQFIKDACDGDEELIILLQEVMGYALSFSSCIKSAVVFYGPHNTGKSSILRLIMDMVGNENVSNVNVQDYSNPTFAATLMDRAINIAPDLPSSIIKDISAFKSLVSGNDTITTRELYKNPKSMPCTTKHFFGSNQFPQLAKDMTEDNINAFMSRLLFVPFLKQKSADEMNHNLSKELAAEADYIFTWAMKGLRRLYKNNWVFTRCKKSEEILSEYKSQYTPEAVFFNKYIEITDDSDDFILTTDLQDQYEQYAMELGISCGNHDMVKYIKKHYPDKYSPKKRCKGYKNGRAVFLGLKLKEDELLFDI